MLRRGYMFFINIALIASSIIMMPFKPVILFGSYVLGIEKVLKLLKSTL